MASFSTNQNSIQPQTVDSVFYFLQCSEKPGMDFQDIVPFEQVSSNKSVTTSGEAGGLTAISEVSKPDESVALKYSDGILLVLLVLFSMVAYAKITGKKYISRVFTSVMNYSYSNSFFRETNLANNLNSLILNTVYYISMGLCLSILVDYFDYQEIMPYKWRLLIFYILFVFSLNSLYAFFYRILGITTDKYSEVSEFLFFFRNILKVLGIAYVFLLFGAYFSTGTVKAVFVYSIILVTIFTVFVKFYRILVTILRNRFSLYYSILYFCALEIIPVALLVKILVLVDEKELSLINLLV